MSSAGAEWFDSHCHLHICEEHDSLDELVARARAVGVTAMLTAGVDLASSRRSVEIAKTYGVWAAVGVHPNDCADWDDDTAAELERMTGWHDGVVAVGETGLDFFRDETPKDLQHVAFEAQIEVAKRRDKALVIHTRASVAVAIDVLEHTGPPDRLVFHCWSGDDTDLRRALDLGAYVSFAGNISFKNATELRALAANVPDHRLLAETDSPFLAPVPHRGRANEPAYLPDVGRAVALARGVSVELVRERTAANAAALFQVP